MNETDRDVPPERLRPPGRRYETRYILGLDIGQAQDPTALIVIERFLTLMDVNPVTGEKKFKAHYHVRHIERFALGASYGSYEDRTKELCEREPVRGNSVLVVDHTGVGRRVVESLREKLQGTTPLGVAGSATWIVPVNITAGAKVNFEDGIYNVPKRDLVGVIQVLLGSERLKIGEELSLAPLLIKELQNFRVRYTQHGNETYEAWREGDHDDLVLATALACWWGENYGAVGLSVPEPPRGNPFAMRLGTR